MKLGAKDNGFSKFVKILSYSDILSVFSPFVKIFKKIYHLKKFHSMSMTGIVMWNQNVFKDKIGAGQS